MVILATCRLVSWAAARWRGEPQSVALRIGTLMNACGLMQLIALNIGLQAGIVTDEMFTALVLVALITTAMATPVLGWPDRRDAHRAAAKAEGIGGLRDAPEPVGTAIFSGKA